MQPNEVSELLDVLKATNSQLATIAALLEVQARIATMQLNLMVNPASQGVRLFKIDEFVEQMTNDIETNE